MSTTDVVRVAGAPVPWLELARRWVYRSGGAGNLDDLIVEFDERGFVAHVGPPTHL